VNAATYALRYDVRTDFEPVALMSSYPVVVAAKHSLPPNDLSGLIGWLKANPDKASSGTSGVATSLHVAGVLFQKLTDTRFQHVPYRGSAPAMQDLVAGNVDLMFTDTTTALPPLRAGLIKVYAVAAEHRMPSAPDIPTAGEAGLPGFHISLWQALWAPKGTPKELIAKIHAAVADSLADATVRSRLSDLGQEIFPPERQTPEALRALHKAEIEKWWPVIKAAGIKAE
jgi:tripartite-type tricarboxylate transporter receptor subunit TctC